MASDKQIKANRLNAKRSTGPRTEIGKRTARTNAIRHGLTATILVIPGEEPAALDQFADQIFGELDPAGPTQIQLVDRIVSLLWRLRRVPVLEAALFAWIYHFK